MQPIHFTPTPALQANIEALLALGQYNDESIIIEKAVALLVAQTSPIAMQTYAHLNDSRLRAALQKGIDEAERGECVPFDPEKIWAEAQKNIKNNVPFTYDRDVLGNV